MTRRSAWLSWAVSSRMLSPAALQTAKLRNSGKINCQVRLKEGKERKKERKTEGKESVEQLLKKWKWKLLMRLGDWSAAPSLTLSLSLSLSPCTIFFSSSSFFPPFLPFSRCSVYLFACVSYQSINRLHYNPIEPNLPTQPNPSSLSLFSLEVRLGYRSHTHPPPPYTYFLVFPLPSSCT